MIHPVDAPLVFAPRRNHPASAGGSPGEQQPGGPHVEHHPHPHHHHPASAKRTTVYNRLHSTTDHQVAVSGMISPQILRDDYNTNNSPGGGGSGSNRPPFFSTWGQLSKSIGRMPVTSSSSDHHQQQQYQQQQQHYQQQQQQQRADSIDAGIAATITAANTKPAKRPDILHFPAPVLTPSSEAPLELKTAELNIGANSIAHHTDSYYCTQRAKGPQLVLRRGEQFAITLTFYRPFDPVNDSLKLIFEIGELPTIANMTKVIIPVTNGNVVSGRSGGWWAEITKAEETKLHLRIHITSNAAVGCWNLKVVSSLKHHQPSGAGFMDSVSLIHGVWILFNPWNPKDSTYLENESEREEYVLNDSGKIWRGSHNSLRPTYWNFGQFEPGVLEAAMCVLDRSRLPYPQRSSGAHVARLVAQMTNSPDGNGVVAGNWSNDQGGGTPPTEWAGSVRILRQYAETGHSAYYGQCWVFAGVITTILRCLGIPSRVVTNYASAHDSGTGLTIDLHINNTGKIDRAYTTDSIWAYHVWNECWLSRPDLPEGYGGWQVVDATPQEKSNGLYFLGPTSVRAIRDRRMGYSHDSAYLFAEVNARKCYWLMNEDGSERLVDVRPNETGLCISTKQPGKLFTGMNSEDRLDITQMYKSSSADLDGHRSDLDALLPGHLEQVEALLAKPSGTSGKERGDVEMSWAMNNKAIRLGEDFNVNVSLVNHSSEERTVKINLRIESMHYFGAEMHKIRSETKAITLTPGETQQAKMSVSLRDYLSKAMPQYSFMLTSLARVMQTGQIFLSTDDFRVKMPNVTVRAPDQLQVGQTSTIVLEFVNPLPVMLTKCKFVVEGPALITSASVPCRDVSPRGICKSECRVTPWRAGRDLVFVAHFSSDQLQDIDGAASINISNNNGPTNS